MKITEKLRDALRKKDLREDVIGKVVESAASFALYGFPESHGSSFALLAYSSTLLRVHRGAEFYASLQKNQPMVFDSAATLIQDGRRHGLKVKSVCVQTSEWKCTVIADDTIRIGLSYVKGLKEAHAQSMIAVRQGRPFATLEDFLCRTEFTAAERRALAAVGALNALAGHRRAALWQVEAAWSTEESLFYSAESLINNSQPAPLLPMSLTERLKADFRGLDLTAGEHPPPLARDRFPQVGRACGPPPPPAPARVTPD